MLYVSLVLGSTILPLLKSHPGLPRLAAALPTHQQWLCHPAASPFDPARSDTWWLSLVKCSEKQCGGEKKNTAGQRSWFAGETLLPSVQWRAVLGALRCSYCLSRSAISFRLMWLLKEVTTGWRDFQRVFADTFTQAVLTTCFWLSTYWRVISEWQTETESSSCWSQMLIGVWLKMRSKKNFFLEIKIGIIVIKKPNLQ